MGKNVDCRLRTANVYVRTLHRKAKHDDVVVVLQLGLAAAAAAAAAVMLLACLPQLARGNVGVVVIVGVVKVGGVGGWVRGAV